MTPLPKIFFQLLTVISYIRIATSIPVDNSVVGEPEVECGPDSVTVNFNTENTFEGHVYVKGLFASDDCRRSAGGRRTAGIEIRFNECNTRRTRSLNPKGMSIFTTVIITFHPLFLTKVDQAVRIQCFYMETDKTVDTGLEVSMLTTELQTQQVPMPICQYTILEGGPSGPEVEFAVVGQKVYHKWNCRTETVDTFCMVVHSCTVDDTFGQTVELVGGNGCAVDRNLLNNLEYPADLMAGIETHVFKYADRADLYFQCQITILAKEPGLECPRPNCPEPGSRGAGDQNVQEGVAPSSDGKEIYPLFPGSPYLPDFRVSFDRAAILSSDNEILATGASRQKREIRKSMIEELGTLDVQSSFGALDLTENTPDILITDDAVLMHSTRTSGGESGGNGKSISALFRQRVCLSIYVVYILSFCSLLVLTAILVTLGFVAFRTQR